MAVCCAPTQVNVKRVTTPLLGLLQDNNQTSRSSNHLWRLTETLSFDLLRRCATDYSYCHLSFRPVVITIAILLYIFSTSSQVFKVITAAIFYDDRRNRELPNTAPSACRLAITVHISTMSPMVAELSVTQAQRPKCATLDREALPIEGSCTATCSPDELLGRTIEVLSPKYNIDAPHLLALRNVFSAAIIQPRKPPRLMRTRPDKRIGQIGSIHDTPRASAYGVNGPPSSINRTFYFHHKDPDFERLLPQTDISRYKSDESGIHSGSDIQEIADSQQCTQAKVSAAAAVRDGSSQPVAPATSRPAERNNSTSVEFTQQTEEMRQAVTSQQELNNSSTPNLQSTSTFLHGVSSPKTSQSSVVPTTIIQYLDSKQLSARNESENATASAPLLRAASVDIQPPDTQDTHSVSRLFPDSLSCIPRLSETQDSQNTFASTQESDVFSPPVDNLQYTAPTQNDSQDAVLLEVEIDDMSNIVTAGQICKRSPRRSDRPASSHSSSSRSSLGKHSRRVSEIEDDVLLHKRSRAL